MAKKKKDYRSMTEEQLTAEMDVSKEAKDAEGMEAAQKELKMRKFKEDTAKKMEKKFLNLGKYKEKINYKEPVYKPQEWIDMSPAWKEETCLPGMPAGSVICVGGLPDSGKSTAAMEAAAYAQRQGIVPVFIITENKFSFDRARKMGVNFDNAIVYNGIKTIEEGCVYVKNVLDDQETGKLPFDVLIIWDSIGSTPSEAELKKQEEESGRAMMETAKVIREKIGRYLSHRINNTRNETYPYTATFLIVNQAYSGPSDVPGGPPKLVFYGGGGVTYSASLIIRMGGIKSSSSKIMATKDGIELAFAIRTAIVVEKNHVTNVATKGKIICTDHGFIRDDKAAIDEYKSNNKEGWELTYDNQNDAIELE